MNKVVDTYDLSIIVVTYNHEKYISQALSSIFEQDIQGSVELIIADDASSDNTLNIIRDFENKNPYFHFNYLDNSINVGITKNYQRAFSACKGKYIAVLEGDDYWSANYKLRRQIDFLNEHIECDLCSVNYLVFEEEKSQYTPRVAESDGHRFIKAQDLIMDNLIGNFSTCMYRRTALLRLPSSLFEMCSYDWIVNICVAQESLIGFLEEPMSVYRLHANGVWSSIGQIEKLKEQAEIIPSYNALTNYQFDHEFNVLRTGLNEAISQLSATVTIQDMTEATEKQEYRVLNMLLRFWKSIITPFKWKRLGD